MMVQEAPDGSGLCLIIVTDYKAGINFYQKFPESEVNLDIPADWLIQNWNKWVWPEGNVDDVLIHEALKPSDL